MSRFCGKVSGGASERVKAVYLMIADRSELLSS